MAISNPTSIAIVRSKITVRKKVTSNTDTSLFGFFISERNVRHSLILYETIINTPARQAIGICLVNGPKKSKISNNTIAWMMPATGVRPPLLIFVMVRAIAPVTGIPPKTGTMILAAPCAISSVLELCLSPVSPSATVADSNDSIAPNIAMVNAEGSRRLIVSILKLIVSGPGREALIVKRSPIVSIPVIPK